MKNDFFFGGSENYVYLCKKLRTIIISSKSRFEIIEK